MAGGGDTGGMKFRTTAGALAAGLTAGEAGARGVGLVRLGVTGEHVAISGTDGEVGVDLILRAEGVQDGEVVVPPRSIIAYSQTLEPEVGLEITLDGRTLNITGDGRVYRFSTSETRLVTIEKPGEGAHRAKAGHVGAMFVVVRHAVDPRNNLVKLSHADERLRMYATDTYRVASTGVAAEAGDAWSALFPVGGLQLALKWSPEELTIDPKGRVAVFTGGGVETTIRLGAAEFPAVESVTDRHGAQHWGLRRAEVSRAVQRIATVAGNEALKCSIQDGELCIKVNSGEGSGVEYAGVEGEGEGWFGIGAKNLMEALNSLDSDVVDLYYDDPKKPIYLCGNGTTLVIMPVVWSGGE